MTDLSTKNSTMINYIQRSPLRIVYNQVELFCERYVVESVKTLGTVSFTVKAYLDKKAKVRSNIGRATYSIAGGRLRLNNEARISLSEETRLGLRDALRRLFEVQTTLPNTSTS